MPISSFEKTNLNSKKVRTFNILLLILFGVYLLGCILFVGIRMMGESYPKTVEAFAELLKGMNMDQAWPLFRLSIQFLVLSVIFLLSFWLLRWQILRTVLLAFALLGLAYLGCAILLLAVQGPLWHVVTLVVLALLFAFMFITQSNIWIYWRDRTYKDVVIESIVVLGFLYFIVQMLAMALTGRTS